MSIRLITIVGARPQIIKAAAISRQIRAINNSSGALCLRIEECILPRKRRKKVPFYRDFYDMA